MSSSDTSTDEELVEVTVEDVTIDASTNAPVLRLIDGRGGHRLEIFIGQPEAFAITAALQAMPHQRPMTHDALKQIIDALGGRLVRIVVGFMPENTFTADVVVALVDGREHHLDWRPSDSIALAVRCDPRPAILVPRSLLDRPPQVRPIGMSVPCPCGQRVLVSEDALANAPAEGDVAEVEFDCPSCGRHRLVLLARPPTLR